MRDLNSILTGKWQIVCWNINTANGYEKLKIRRHNSLFWEFQPDGTLVETIIGKKPVKTKYYFYPDELMLAIDRSDYADDGYMLACIEEHYRVDFLSERYMILYGLEDVEVEPDDYVFLMEWEKL